MLRPLTDFMPLVRWLEVTVGDFHAFLGRWLDLWEDGPGSVTANRARRPPASATSVTDPVPGPEAIGHGRLTWHH
jgi:hypothetical protein